MLLNELQKQGHDNDRQARELDALHAQVAALKASQASQRNAV
jgi:hypothetical protein